MELSDIRVGFGFGFPATEIPFTFQAITIEDVKNIKVVKCFLWR